MNCEKCGARLPKGKNYCVRCGGQKQAVNDSLKEMINEEPQSILSNDYLPMRFHAFYIFILILSIVLQIISIPVYGISVVIAVLLESIYCYLLAKRTKLGYQLLMAFTIIEIVLIFIYFIKGILLLLNIGTVSLLNIGPLNAIFSILMMFLGPIGLLFISVTCIVILLILYAIIKYYSKRKDMFYN